MANAQHSVIREGDEVYCRVCGKRWDINDPYPPKCLTKKEKGINQIKKLKRQFFTGRM